MLSPFAAAVAAIVWMLLTAFLLLMYVLERRDRKLADKRLTVANAQLRTYRQWADPHIHLAFPDPSKHDGGDAR